MVQTEKEAEFAFRGRMDIIADILTVAAKGTKKTRIMYMCNLSYRQLGTYLNLLIKKGFLAVLDSEREKTATFKTTKKGTSFLRAYEALQAVISS